MEGLSHSIDTVSNRDKENQPETPINNGEGILVRHKVLYHGSNVSGIETFNEAEEHTVGKGVYFTSSEKDAQSYAKVRAGERKPQVIYEIVIENMRMLDMRTTEKVKKIMLGFREKIIENNNSRKPSNNPLIEEIIQETTAKIIQEISRDKIDITNIRSATKFYGDLFTKYVQSLGYDGLITYEGGEGRDFSDHDHDTYLIFDPQKIKITNEQTINT